MYISEGELQPGVFRAHGAGMSVNWQKYCTAVQTRRLAKNPADNGVLAFDSAGAIRSIRGLTVEHTPDRERMVRSHAEVLGDVTSAAVRVALKKISSWAIHLPDPME